MRKPLLSVTKNDLEITYYSGTGAGGQHRNRHMNSCRIQHKPSGVIVTASDSRSKDTNTKMAFRRLVNHDSFKKWVRIESSKAMVDIASVEQFVREAMRPENLLIEIKENGKWQEVEND